MYMFKLFLQLFHGSGRQESGIRWDGVEWDGRQHTSLSCFFDSSTVRAGSGAESDGMDWNGRGGNVHL